MAVIQQTAAPRPIAGDRSGADVVASRPVFRKRAGTRKRAGAVLAAALASMVQSYWAVPDQTRPRAASDARRNNHKLRQQIASLLDQLLAGRDKELPTAIHGLHLLLGEVATRRYAGSDEQKIRPFVAAYGGSGTREDLLLMHERLSVLEGAESLFATMNETNRQDVQGVMAALKRSLMQELARRGASEPLRQLTGHLAARDPDVRGIMKAWFWLDEAVRAAEREGLQAVPYLHAGLESLPAQATRTLAVVLAPSVPPHVRPMREVLEAAVYWATVDAAQTEPMNAVSVDLVSQSVRSRIIAELDDQVAEAARKLENGLRHDSRTAEIANGACHDMAQALRSLGWFYAFGEFDQDAEITEEGFARNEDAAIHSETECQFIRALTLLDRRTAAACIARLDTERLIAMHAGRSGWNDFQRFFLGPALDRASESRYIGLMGAAESARLDVIAVVDQDRRIAVAHALTALSDALASAERFAAHASIMSRQDDDPRIDDAIRRAAGSLRMAGDTGHALGVGSLRALSDAEFSDLRQCGDGLSFRSLALDADAVAAELVRRSDSFDSALLEQAARFAAWLRSPALAPRVFTAMMALLSETARARREGVASLSGSSVAAAAHADDTPQVLSQVLDAALYRDGASPPAHWTEVRRHVDGLLSLLWKIRGAAGPARRRVMGADNAWAGPLARVDITLSLLDTVGRHAGIGGSRCVPAAPPDASADPYWNDQRLLDVAACFGIGFDAAGRHAQPLFGAVHRARLLAALAMKMADPCDLEFEPVVLRAGEKAQECAVDRHFHRKVYQSGEFSVSFDGRAGSGARLPYPAGTQPDTLPQDSAQVDDVIASLARGGRENVRQLTRMMSVVARGVQDFIASARDIPSDRWGRLAFPESLRHIHFGISEQPHGGHRLSVSALLDTTQADTTARLTFVLQTDVSNRRVTGLIVAPDMCLLPDVPLMAGNRPPASVTTGGHAVKSGSIEASDDAVVLMTAGG